MIFFRTAFTIAPDLFGEERFLHDPETEIPEEVIPISQREKSGFFSGEEIHLPGECPEIYRRLCEEKTFPVVQFDWSDMK